jgi:alkylhydroperoxidase family enzyme
MTDPLRLPPLPPSERSERVDELLRGLRGGVVGAGPDETDLNIFATLARHPRLLRRWSAFGGVLLTGELPARDRELLILRTAWHCRAHYEWAQHVGIGIRAGLTEEEIDRIPAGPATGNWSGLDAALLTAADELHADARLSDATWAELAGAYTEAQLIEVCMVVGQYHMVAFTLNSLGVQPEPGLPSLPE